jgi:hypothetical protein
MDWCTAAWTREGYEGRSAGGGKEATDYGLARELCEVQVCIGLPREANVHGGTGTFVPAARRLMEERNQFVPVEVFAGLAFDRWVARRRHGHSSFAPKW